MTRPIAFDVTHLVSRLHVDTPSGIDKVDLAFANHFSGDAQLLVHYGLRQPRFHDGDGLGRLTNAGMARWGGRGSYGDAAWRRIAGFLTGREEGPRLELNDADAELVPAASSGTTPGTTTWRRMQQVGWRLAAGNVSMPRDGIYLNVAQHVFEEERFFRWLAALPNVCPVFMVHDLLPLDYPEYFRAGYRPRFERRVETIMTYARGVLVASQAVRTRLEVEYAKRGQAIVPIHVAPLPSSLPPIEARFSPFAELVSVPYFVVLGTIEPRKNHLLLLNIWRRLAEQIQTGRHGEAVMPKLIIVGGRGWENEQVVDVLERSALVKPNVIEVSNLDDRRLAILIANARGLLFPSFAEGYGLPLVEALSLRTPVIASDIPVFREVSQGCALFASPLDGPRWLDLIIALSDQTSEGAIKARGLAEDFAGPDWPSYFKSIKSFLASLD